MFYIHIYNNFDKANLLNAPLGRLAGDGPVGDPMPILENQHNISHSVSREPMFCLQILQQ